jgi:phage terminase large subunit-like protein
MQSQLLQRLASLSPQALAALGTEVKLKLSQNRLADYKPYPKQLEFHDAGGDPAVRERLLIAGNQLGKTWSAGFEVAMHLTGEYPAWWEGKRWNREVLGWAAGVTSESTRDNPQKILLGLPGAFGTGAIPQKSIVEVTRASHGVADSIDSIKVRHKSGGLSIVSFKAYEKGREKWQGPSLDFVWFDEEPPEDIYSEGLTRTNVGSNGAEGISGITFITFTPLLGMSNVVKKFLTDKSPGTEVIKMTIDDALHYTEVQRASIVASYPAHEREARANGIPILGSGRIFPVSEEVIREMPVSIPAFWPRICGMDFGWDHPTAAVWLAWDRDTDTIHVYDAYRVKEAPALMHAAAIRAKGAWIPVAWPHDGLQHDKGSGEQLAKQYKDHGLAMLKERATFLDGSNGVEAGLSDLLDRMNTGRFKVAKHLHDWWEEFRLYHRKDGKVVKVNDDLLSATRYALMMLRFAKTGKPPKAADVAAYRPSDAVMGL